MKKLIFLIIIFPLLGIAQNNTKIKYRTVAAITSLMNSEGEIVFQKTIGKDPIIVFDPFFKSYSITFTEENGDVAEIFLSYREPSLYADTFDSTYNIIDTLANGGDLILILTKKLESHTSILMFITATKI
ncbi:hypothetical protein [Bizionia paragorgiae]|uniref:hypothetical protein n=1 Tax=Bizionia paragorgiae TaxID=283786 RepID=UPI003A8CD150